MAAYLKELLNFATSYLTAQRVIKIRAKYEFSGTDEYPVATDHLPLTTDMCLIIAFK